MTIRGRGLSTIFLALFLIGYGIALVIPGLQPVSWLLAALALIAGVLMLFGA